MDCAKDIAKTGPMGFFKVKTGYTLFVIHSSITC